MPGITLDGSEDLPNDKSDWMNYADLRTPTRLGICPFCYEHATHMAKDMVGTRFCKNGHKWQPYMSLLAVPHLKTPVKAPAENCVYGVCPACREPGIQRYRDGVGTTICRNQHSWVPSKVVESEPENNGTKPIATEQKPVYDERHQANLIDRIKSVVEKSAIQVREDAGYAGGPGDGGAYTMKAQLQYWLDGIEFAKTGQTKLYQSIVDKFEKEQDPEYQTWLKLNQKFGKMIQ